MPLAPNSASDLFATVVASGCCIGCGACAAFDASIQIKFDDFGRYVATLSPKATSVAPTAARVCPFADGVPDEDAISREAFCAGITLDPHLGHVLATYAGWVTEADFRATGSSGGLASWVLVELLKQGLVDHVVHVIPQPVKDTGTPLFKFAISSSPEAIRGGAKSRYYPVEMSGVLRQMLEQPGRYAVVGIPCFIKAIRLACRESAVLRERVKFTVAIVCGHLKSKAFAELFAWQCGIAPSELRGIDFRTKLPDRPASSYAVTVEGERDGQRFTVTKPTSELFGSNWGHGFFKYKACDFCDDVVGETADISIGDAWLPEYERDARGTNVVVVRSPVLHAMVNDAMQAGRLHFNTIPAGRVVESQAGGFRHRRAGLAYRLHVEAEAGRWRPTKRVQPASQILSAAQREIYELRYTMGQQSHDAFARAKRLGRPDSFFAAMQPLMTRHDRYYRPPLIRRLLGRIKRRLVSLVGAPK